MGDRLTEALQVALHFAQCERDGWGGCKGPSDPEHQAESVDASAAVLALVESEEARQAISARFQDGTYTGQPGRRGFGWENPNG